MGKHLRFTPNTLSDDASYFLASKCLGSIFQMGFKVSHLQIGDSLTEETKIFHTWTDWIENHKNDRKIEPVNLRKTSRTDLPEGFSRSKKITSGLTVCIGSWLLQHACISLVTDRINLYLTSFPRDWGVAWVDRLDKMTFCLLTPSPF